MERISKVLTGILVAITDTELEFVILERVLIVAVSVPAILLLSFSPICVDV